MRIIAFIVLIFICTLLPWYLALACACVYAFYYTAYELLILALMIDAYYGAYSVVPYYTLGTVMILVSVDFIKPRFLV